MNSIALYMEGGGQRPGTKAALRQGMDAFLAEIKDAARAKSWHWKLVCCGSRDRAYRDFDNAQATCEHAVAVLLVDAEETVNAGPCTHLSS